MSESTGYSVKFKDFVQLLTYPAYKKVIIPLIEEWFDGEFITVDKDLYLETTIGEHLSLSDLHTTIQADTHKQYKLYQAAMSLWR